MRLVWAAIASVLLAACSGANPPPSTPLPSATPAPTVVTTAVSTPTAEADPSEVEQAFLDNVDDVIAEAADLADTPCDDLVAATTRNPNLVPSIRGFAATMKRVSTSQAALDTEAVKSAIGDLDRTIGQLEGALSLCGISQR